jgi:hypothetical protein
VTLRTDGEIVQSLELFEEAQASDLLLVRDCSAARTNGVCGGASSSFDLWSGPQ